MNITSFADILHPLTPEEFFRDYHGKKPVHIPGAPDKLASLIDRETLSDLLEQKDIWTGILLKLVLDTQILPAEEYCRPAMDREGRDAMLADMDMVSTWLQRGASMICNAVDSLTPGLRAAANALEHGLCARALANLYYSQRSRQAYATHFDPHDAYALHISGEKTWRIYQRYFEHPIPHPMFQGLGQAFHEQHKGPVSQEVTLTPGDMLYIPAGWYHDATASSDTCIHVTFGMTRAIGLELIQLLFDRAVSDPMFRQSLPSPDTANGKDLSDHIVFLGNRLSEYTKDPDVLEAISSAIRASHYDRRPPRF